MQHKWRMISFSLGLFAILFWGCGEKSGGETADGTVDVVTNDSLGDSASVENRIRNLTEQLRFSKTNWELYMERSKLWYEAGNIPQAMADIDRAIENHIMGPENYYLKGFYYYAQRQDSEATRQLRKAVDLGSEDPETYYLLGQLRYLAKDYTGADNWYNTAISLDSMQPTYYFAKGYLAQTQERFDEAIEIYRVALQRDPTFVKVLLALHDIYLNVKKDADQAFAFNERVILVDSTQPVARFNQGNFFMARANILTEEEELVEFQVLIKIAISEYNRCLEVDPNYVEAYYNRGYCFFLLNQFGPALNDFSTVIELDAFNDRAFFMKASIQEVQGDMVSALENYRQAVRINPQFRDAEKAVKELSLKLKAQTG
ncbi:MAG: tetratricopeptide repeat protein [Bacteroidota bacterium]